jgi:hypothetical protein
MKRVCPFVYGLKNDDISENKLSPTCKNILKDNNKTPLLGKKANSLPQDDFF